jgi:hypothetical protein
MARAASGFRTDTRWWINEDGGKCWRHSSNGGRWILESDTVIFSSGFFVLELRGLEFVVEEYWRTSARRGSIGNEGLWEGSLSE